MIDAYPLQWPIGRKRTESYNRKGDPFHMPGGKIRYELARELKLMDSPDFVISSNLLVRNDGLPYAGQKAPEDPGIALYFNRKGVDICISCDQYGSVDANLRAIGKTIEAIRGIERWGTEEMMDAAFSGFKALPEQGGTTIIMNEAWFDILGVVQHATKDEIRNAYRKMAKIYHPDNGGDAGEFERIRNAFEQGMNQ